MFTGLIEEVAEVVRIDNVPHGSQLTLRATRVIEGLREGDSVAIDGVCLTARGIGKGKFVTDVSPETITRTNLVYYQIGTAVNLERPVAAGGRLGGHIVQGHVDATTQMTNKREEGDFVWMTFSIPDGMRPFLVEKGSVAINGASLTIAKIRKEEFDVQLVPHTIGNTNLVSEARSDSMNLEADILGKYVESLLRERLGLAPEETVSQDGELLGRRKFIELPGDSA